jgi:SAM-dependent methyltransferase
LSAGPADGLPARWSAAAAVWAEHWARLGDPARTVLLERAGAGPGRRLLDLGCGSGELLARAAALGAEVAGLDAAPGMVELARARVPGADVRTGDLTADLPWPDGSFDVVTAVNALGFAPDYRAALTGCARLLRPGGLVAVANWGRHAECEIGVVDDAMAALVLEPGAQPPPERPIRGPGGLERVAREAGLRPTAAGAVDAPWGVPDRATLEAAFMLDAQLVPELAALDPALITRAVAAAAEPFRQPDGSYRFANVFRWVVAAA